MNRTVFLLLISLLFSCKSPSQEDKSENIKTSAISLEKSFSIKDEETFLKEFPRNFLEFKNTFGWDDEKDAPEALYKNSKVYIDYWFSLIQKPKYNKYESRIIDISKGGIWEADAVGYFRDRASNYIKENKRYSLIDSLSNTDAKSVLSFLINDNASMESDFISHLDKEKKKIGESIGLKNISSDKKRASIQTYENNRDYFIKTFDVNKDGLMDKVVSSVAYKGEDLFVFFGNKSGAYDLSLETTNFSEDGGNIIKSVSEIPNNKGLKIITSFPDRGYYEKEFTIIPENNTWILKNIIYRTMSDVSENPVKYICEVSQNLDMTKSGWSEKLNPIPEEAERNKKCRIESTVGHEIKRYKIQDQDGFTNLRKEQNTTSQILQKINSGENIEILNRSGDWLFIRTAAGNQGYVHKSRVKPN
jgi:hypothetical protein